MGADEVLPPDDGRAQDDDREGSVRLAKMSVVSRARRLLGWARYPVIVVYLSLVVGVYILFLVPGAPMRPPPARSAETGELPHGVEKFCDGTTLVYLTPLRAGGGARGIAVVPGSHECRR